MDEISLLEALGSPSPELLPPAAGSNEWAARRNCLRHHLLDPGARVVGIRRLALRLDRLSLLRHQKVQVRDGIAVLALLFADRAKGLVQRFRIARRGAAMYGAPRRQWRVACRWSPSRRCDAGWVTRLMSARDRERRRGNVADGVGSPDDMNSTRGSASDVMAASARCNPVCTLMS